MVVLTAVRVIVIILSGVYDAGRWRNWLRQWTATGWYAAPTIIVPASVIIASGPIKAARTCSIVAAATILVGALRIRVRDISKDDEADQQPREF